MFKKCSGSGVNIFVNFLFLTSYATRGAVRKPFSESDLFIKSVDKRAIVKKNEEVPNSDTGLVFVMIRLLDANLRHAILRPIPCSEKLKSDLFF